MQKELGIGSVGEEEKRRLSAVTEGKAHTGKAGAGGGKGPGERTERKSGNRTRRRSTSGGMGLSTSSIHSDDSGSTKDSGSRGGRRSSKSVGRARRNSKAE